VGARLRGALFRGRVSLRVPLLARNGARHQYKGTACFAIICRILTANSSELDIALNGVLQAVAHY
jgi:hypothetical protein